MWVGVSILKRVIREGLTEKVTFEQRPGLGVGGIDMWMSVRICMNLHTFVCEWPRF